MKRIAVLKLVESIWNIGRWHYLASTLLIVLWIISSVVFPFILSSGNWNDVQNIYQRWQTINAAFIAFIAAILTYKAAEIRDVNRVRRRYVAEKAMLHARLSELSEYFEEAFKYLDFLYKNKEFLNSGVGRIDVILPLLQDNYNSRFREIIEVSPPSVGEYIAVMLAELQIHLSRMRGLHESINSSRMIVLPINIFDYSRGLAVLQCRVNKLFLFARSSSDFEYLENITLQELKQVLQVHQMNFDDIDRLDEYLSKTVSRANSLWSQFD